MKYGVFWIPPNPLQAIIAEEKLRAEKRFPDATYLSHPVHATLFVVDIPPHNEVLQPLQAVIRTCQPVATAVTGWHVFENDVSTGADTVVAMLDPTPGFRRLQVLVADALSSLRLIRNTTEDDDRSWPEPFRGSVLRYGYPFVGDHWLPHVTVASFPSDSSYVETVLERKLPAESLTVEKLSLWEIDGDHHRYCEDIPFKGAL